MPTSVRVTVLREKVPWQSSRGIQVIPHNKPHKRFTGKNTGEWLTLLQREAAENREGGGFIWGLLGAELFEGRYWWDFNS